MHFKILAAGIENGYSSTLTFKVSGHFYSDVQETAFKVAVVYFIQCKYQT